MEPRPRSIDFRMSYFNFAELKGNRITLMAGVKISNGVIRRMEETLNLDIKINYYVSCIFSRIFHIRNIRTIIVSIMGQARL